MRAAVLQALRRKDGTCSAKSKCVRIYFKIAFLWVFLIYSIGKPAIVSLCVVYLCVIFSRNAPIRGVMMRSLSVFILVFTLAFPTLSTAQGCTSSCDASGVCSTECPSQMPPPPPSSVPPPPAMDVTVYCNTGWQICTFMTRNPRPQGAPCQCGGIAGASSW